MYQKKQTREGSFQSRNKHMKNYFIVFFLKKKCQSNEVWALDYIIK